MTETSKVFGGQLISESGGTIELDPEQPMECPGTIQSTEYGAAFGPLELSAYPDSTARVGGLEFQETEGIIDSLFGTGAEGGLFGSLALVASDARNTDDDDDSDMVNRRDVLRTCAAGGLLIGSTAAVARASTTTYTKAQFSVTENPGGLRIRVFDRVENVLPADTLYYTYVDGISYASFSADNDSDYGDVLPKATGTVTVGPEGSGGSFFASLLNDKTQVYEGIALSKATSDADTGEELTITDNDIIVEHVQSAGSGNTTLAINGTPVPHEHENATSPLGYYGVHNGVLIYRTGSSPPDGQTADLVLYADRTTEILDDIERRA